jgi:hypothetical protein
MKGDASLRATLVCNIIARKPKLLNVRIKYTTKKEEIGDT